MALKINVQRSLRECILRLIFLILQKINKKIRARDDLHQTITGVGISINFPNAPDVLINSVAMLSNKNCL